MTEKIKDMPDLISADKPDNFDIPDFLKDISTDENQSLMVAKEMFTNKNLNMKSELSDREITLFSKVYFYAEEFNVPILINLTNHFLALRISKLRAGRKEFIDSLKSHKDEEQAKGGILGAIRAGKI